ncbi:MAG: carbohydrate kinase [Anaerolineae bacterium]|nr:gluconokinase [Anaerolineales bacterium]MCQ3972121.1 carbohydrate kinase [Anaerolineae bacterium]
MPANSPQPNPIALPLILTLDVGTSSTRAMLFDSQARPVPDLQAQIPSQVQTTADGGSEFDPAELLRGVIAAIDQVLHLAGPLAQHICGVALDTLVTNMLGLDSAGQPLTPVYTYADTRNAADADALCAELGGMTAAHDRTGCLIHSAYWPARFRWLARTQPDLYRQTAHWVSLGDYLFQEFLGQRQVSYSVASWSGLLNRRELAWDREWLVYLSLDEDRLSPLTDVDQPVRGLRSPWAERWPALKDVPWFPAIGDGAAANIGSGCAGPQRVALTMGTTGAMRVALEQNPAAAPEGLWVYRVDRRRALVGGATSEGGNVYAWLKQSLQLPPDEAEQLAALAPAAHGLTVLPFVAGERAPGWQSRARASLIGFTLNTRPIEILRAGLEGVAYRFALIQQRLAPHLPPDYQIIASGSGLLNSPVWLQIMADVLGHPVIASAETEATSRGVAVLALEALDLAQDLPAALGKTYQPNQVHHARYQEALATQLDLYRKLVADG